jgi:hypothetical protein
MANLFQIIDFKRDEGKIIVNIQDREPVSIDECDFNNFLSRHGKLDYPHIKTTKYQLIGGYSLEEYFEFSDEIELDLYDYIICKRLDWRKVKEYFQSELPSILNTYKTAI